MDELKSELRTLAGAARTLIEDEMRRGRKGLLKGPERSVSTASVAKESPQDYLPRRSLEEIRAEIGDCTRCKLHQGRTNLVFGVGNAKADLLFVGEAPGRDEDLQGEPFVGRAGKLLTDIIESIGLKRSEVYICNVVKCRPPENRNPEPDEITACRPFLAAQITSVAPKLICTLGKFAAQTLLDVETPITKLRGKFQSYQGVPVMPTYHPAYLLRNPPAKKDVWEDMKVIHSELCRLTGKTLVRKGA